MSKLKQTKKNHPLDNCDFHIPPEGLHDTERKKLLKNYSKFIFEQKKRFLGYQINQEMEYESDIRQFLNCHINNVGDPYTPGNCTVNSKRMEQAVLDYYAKLWHAKLPHDQSDPESYWGYTLTMGSSEGNIYALWSARDYLAGRKLVVDKSGGNKPARQRRQRYLKPIINEADKKAHTPVAFYSQDTHYSIVKAMRVLAIDTFYNIGSKYYKGKNPIDPQGSWDGYEEVPSKDGNQGVGAIDVDKLEKLVEFFASEGYPILINLNYGSTFKGAYDNVEEITKRLMPIFKKHGLVHRKVVYDEETGDFDYRNGFWIHVDGALGAAYMPFLEMANQKDPSVKCGPKFDFRLPGVTSIVMSGHKWPGAPWPCGIFMTKVKYQITPPADPEYLGSPDSTFAGSRSGLTPVILWDYLAKHSYQKQIEMVLYCEEMAKYAVKQLKTAEPFHKDLGLYIERSPLALTIRFRKPNDEIIFKYSLSCETLEIGGVRRHYAHLFAMASTTKETIDELAKDLQDADAFKREEEKLIAIQRDRGWR
jgi:histidine decarboxylase